MTPEQETYKEYGRAQEALHQTIKEIKKESFFTFGKPYCKLTKLERESISHALGLCGKVRYVRKMRTACRTWAFTPMNKRYCDDCRYYCTSVSDGPCRECCRRLEPVNWEPRKENKN